MLEQVLNQLHNWFVVDIHNGEYTIKDGGIALPFLLSGQYFRIKGSTFNDGLHRYGPDVEVLTDETFTGTIWALAVPRDVVTLAAEMAEWQNKYGAEAAAGIYQSESFSNYSYTKKTNSSGEAVTVWDTFRARLKPYKKLCGMW